MLRNGVLSIAGRSGALFCGVDFFWRGLAYVGASSSRIGHGIGGTLGLLNCPTLVTFPASRSKHDMCCDISHVVVEGSPDCCWGSWRGAGSYTRPVAIAGIHF